MRIDTSTERANRRRLALLALLHRRPYGYGELIAALDKPEFCVCTLHGAKEPGELCEQAREALTNWWG